MAAKVDDPEAKRVQIAEQHARVRDRSSSPRRDRPTFLNNSLRGMSSTSSRSTMNCLVRQKTSVLETSCNSQCRPLTNT